VADVIYFDASYAVGTVSHSLLLWKEGEAWQQTTAQHTGKREDIKHPSEGE